MCNKNFENILLKKRICIYLVVLFVSRRKRTERSVRRVRDDDVPPYEIARDVLLLSVQLLSATHKKKKKNGLVVDIFPRLKIFYFRGIINGHVTSLSPPI